MKPLEVINRINDDYCQGYQDFLDGKPMPANQYRRMGWVEASHQKPKMKAGVVSASQIAAQPNLSFSPKDYLSKRS